MTDFAFDTSTQFKAVTASQYRARAAEAITESTHKPAALLAMLEALFRGQGADVAAAKLEASKREAVAEYDRLCRAMTSREYLPQAAQIELLAELRARVKP